MPSIVKTDLSRLNPCSVASPSTVLCTPLQVFPTCFEAALSIQDASRMLVFNGSSRKSTNKNNFQDWKNISLDSKTCKLNAHVPRLSHRSMCSFKFYFTIGSLNMFRNADVTCIGLPWYRLNEHQSAKSETRSSLNIFINAHATYNIWHRYLQEKCGKTLMMLGDLTNYCGGYT